MAAKRGSKYDILKDIPKYGTNDEKEALEKLLDGFKKRYDLIKAQKELEKAQKKVEKLQTVVAEATEA